MRKRMKMRKMTRTWTRTVILLPQGAVGVLESKQGKTSANFPLEAPHTAPLPI